MSTLLGHVQAVMYNQRLKPLNRNTRVCGAFVVNRVLFIILFFQIQICTCCLYPQDDRASQNNDDVVELDKFIVSASGYAWRYAKSERFEVLTDIDDSKLINLIVGQTERLITLFENNCALFQSTRVGPVKLILIKNKDIVRFYSKENLKGGVSANPEVSLRYQIEGSLASPTPLPVIPLLRRDGEQLIILQLLTDAYISWRVSNNTVAEETAIGLATAIWNSDLTAKKIKSSPPISIFMHKVGGYYDAKRKHRSGTLFSRPLPPVWYINIEKKSIGLLRFNLKYDRDIMRTRTGYRYLGAKERGEIDNLFEQKIERGPSMPLRVALERSLRLGFSISGTEFVDETLSTRESKDFAFYCVFGPHDKNRMAYTKLILDTRKRRLTESVFKECFGVGYDEFFKEMYDYYRSLDKSSSGWGPSIIHVPCVTPPPLEFRKAERSESARIISDWFELNKQPAAARQTLLLADETVPAVRKSPEFVVTLGLNEAQYGDSSKALALLEKAAAEKIVRPRIYHVISDLRLTNILVKNGAKYKLSPDEVDYVLEPLTTALKQPKPTEGTYFSLAILWYHTDCVPPKELLKAMATDFERLFPDNIKLLNQLVPLLAKHGCLDKAVELFAAAEKCVMTSDELKQLAVLKTEAGL